MAAVSYSGTALLLVLCAAALAASYLLAGAPGAAKQLGGTLVISAVPLAAALAVQRRIFWQNTFPTASDYDPWEISQRLRLHDRPLLMLAIAAGISLGAATVVRGWRRGERPAALRVWALAAAAGLLLLPVWDALFHLVRGGENAASLAALPTDGFFGTLAHQKVSRLALLQPLVLPLVLGELARLDRFRAWAPPALALALLGAVLVPPGAGSAGILRADANVTLSNREDEGRWPLLPSHLGLVSPARVFSPDLAAAFRELRRDPGRTPWLATTRTWAQESLVNWGSVMARRRLRVAGVDPGFPAPGDRIIVDDGGDPAVRGHPARVAWQRGTVRILEVASVTAAPPADPHDHPRQRDSVTVLGGDP